MSGKYLTRTMKTILFVVLVIQLLATVEKQVFDFLGYMWAPIIGNFFQIIVIILALFGAHQHYRSCVVVYAAWNLLWLGWNIFVICLYLEVGILNRKGGRYILTLGTDSQSWWVEHGTGCSSTTHNTTTGLSEKTSDKGVPEEYVEGCILQYYYVEVIHATAQVLLAVCGLGAALTVIQASLERGSTGRYLARSRTYVPPPLCSPLLSSSSPLPSLLSYTSSQGGWHHSHPPPSTLVEKRGRGRGGYLPMPTTSSTAARPRDSWCLPTYVSFHHQSMDELSGSFTCGSSLSQPNPTPNHPTQHPYPNEPTLCVSSSSLREGGENNSGEGGGGGSGSGGGGPSGRSNASSAEGLELESCGSLRSSFSSAAATSTTTSTTTSTSTSTTTTAGTTSGPYLRLTTPGELSSSSSLDQTPLVEQA